MIRYQSLSLIHHFVDGICKEIKILDTKQNLINLEEDSDEKNASIICGSNFDCNSWKEKYSKNSPVYPYAKCVDGDAQNEKCLVVTNKNDQPSEKKKELPKGAIAGIAVACVVVVVVIIVVVIVIIKKRNDDSTGEGP